MAKTTKTTKTVEKKGFKLTQAFALWRYKSKDGKRTYLNGHGDSDNKLVAFYNTKKANPKEPDLRAYEKDAEGNLGKESVLSLWCNVSEKTKKKYLTGTYYGNKVVCFINDESKNEKAPYIVGYYREDGTLAKEQKNEEAKEEAETDEDLPF